MKKLLTTLLLLQAVTMTYAGDSGWNYENQDEWVHGYGGYQSPIDIETGEVKDGESLRGIWLDYRVDPQSVVDNGHAIKVGAKGNRALINGRDFDLIQFHFHSKSEHTVDGKHFPVEGHFVHSAEDGRLAVIGVMYVEGKYNEAFDEILDSIPSRGMADDKIEVEYKELFPEDMDYYHYLGSLTTPPLTENVEWYVLKEPVEISGEQIAEFNRYYTKNFREVQDLEGRVILDSGN